MGEAFRLVRDTTLRPFHPVEVKIPAKLPVRYRFVYHFLKDEEKQNSLIPPRDQERVILEGWVK